MISVIIPCYNIEDYIERCVLSVINSEYKQIEIIIVDDGSVDNSGKICDMLAEKYSNITVIHQKNAGLSNARNTGTAAAEGEYISFVDGDDCISPNMYTFLISAMDKYNCDIVQCGYTEFRESVPITENNGISSDRFTVFDKNEAMRELVKNRIFNQTVWNKLYKREIIENLSFAEGKYHEDEFFTWKAFYKSEKIAYTDMPLYYYFKRDNSIMGVGFSEKRLDALEAIKERTDFFKLNLNSLYAESCKALAENCMYQYQCFSADEKADISGECRKKILRYLTEDIKKQTLKTADLKQKIWYKMFFTAPDKTAELRNKLNIGF